MLTSTVGESIAESLSFSIVDEPSVLVTEAEAAAEELLALAQKEFDMGDVEQEVYDDFISKLDHEIDYED